MCTIVAVKFIWQFIKKAGVFMTMQIYRDGSYDFCHYKGAADSFVSNNDFCRIANDNALRQRLFNQLTKGAKSLFIGNLGTETSQYYDRDNDTVESMDTESRRKYGFFAKCSVL